MPNKNPDILNDSDILDIFYQDDKKEYAFTLLVHKYNERLYWHIRKMVGSHDDANDLLQMVFIKIWKYLPDFRRDSQLYTWIYRIATNETLTFLKKKNLNNFLSLDFFKNSASNYKADSYFNGDKLQLELQKQIMSLPPKQRAVFNLRYFQEMKYEEIAKILDTSEGALKASYHHAYQKIKKNLEQLF